MIRRLGTDVLVGVGQEADPLDRLFDVVLRGVDQETLVDLVRDEVGDEALRDILPDLDRLFALVEAQSPRETQFARDVLKALSRVQEFEKDLVRRVYEETKLYRLEVLNAISDADLTEYGGHRLESIKADLKRAEAALEKRLGGLSTDLATKASALALASVDGPVAALLGNVGLPPAVLPVDQLALIQSQTPDLITRITSDTARQVQNVLFQKTLGGLSARQARTRIGELVGDLPTLARRTDVPGKVFSGLRIRTEMIMRTEFNRTYNLVSTSRIDDLASRVPGIGKVWVHRPGASRTPRSNHASLNGKVIFPGDGEKFELASGGSTYLVDGPHDPALPAAEVINCHCRSRVAYSEEVAAEQARRAGGEQKFENEPTGPAPSKKAPAPRKKKAAARVAKAPAKEPIPPPPGPGATVDDHLAYQKKILGRDVDKYPKKADGTWTGRYGDRDLQKQVGQVSNLDLLRKSKRDSRGWNDEAELQGMSDLSEFLYWQAQECERRGIPSLRGVTFVKGGFGANMGDGVLGINPEQFLYSARTKINYLKSPKFFDLSFAEKAAGQTKSTLDRLLAKLADAESDPSSDYAKPNALRALRGAVAQAKRYDDDARGYVRRIAAHDYDKDGLPDFAIHPEPSGGDILQAFFRPGDQTQFKAAGFVQSTYDKTSSTFALCRGDQEMDVLFRHEFGHHIHQITEFARTGDKTRYLVPGMERDLEGSGYTWNGFTTVYGGKNGKEWFAENYALYSLGREWQCSKLFLDFIKAGGLL